MIAKFELRIGHPLRMRKIEGDEDQALCRSEAYLERSVGRVSGESIAMAIWMVAGVLAEALAPIPDW